MSIGLGKSLDCLAPPTEYSACNIHGAGASINNKLASLLSCCPSHRPLHFFGRSDAILNILKHIHILPSHGHGLSLLSSLFWLRVLDPVMNAEALLVLAEGHWLAPIRLQTRVNAPLIPLYFHSSDIETLSKKMTVTHFHEMINNHSFFQLRIALLTFSQVLIACHKAPGCGPSYT